MGRRSKKSQQKKPPTLDREWSVHSNRPPRATEDAQDASLGRWRAGERAAPARRQEQPGPGSGRAPAGGGHAKDRQAARPGDDNPNLIALGTRNKLERHSRDDRGREAHPQTEPTAAPSGDDASEKPEQSPWTRPYLRPYGQLTPPSEDEDAAGATKAIMAPAPAPLTAPNGQPGPHPSFIEVAKPYIFQQKVEAYLAAIGMAEAKEDSIRLQGVQLIDTVRRSLQLPVRTFNTACVYYHKFRLIHSDNEYNLVEAALAALFTACKIEDTLKKSKEIICASFNLKLPPADQLSPDDSRAHQQLEQPSKVIIGLERLMLEGAGFDFRNRQPQKLVIKLSKRSGFAKDRVGKTAYSMSLDLYRTFAPLKQTTAAMAIACVELAARLCDANMERVDHRSRSGIDYSRWKVTRAEVMETMLDLLDLYTHHRASSLIGPNYPLDTYINVRIALNQESKDAALPRYTQSAPPPSPPAPVAPQPPKGPANGLPPKPGTTATTTNGTAAAAAQQQQQKQPPPIALPISAVGTRGLGGTVRFMLDAARARDEKKTVATYFDDEEEEYEVEVEVPVDSGGNERGPPRRGR
ncbi:RNA polymerase II C-terminal domain kinase beta subunit [Neofusicoccum ribis]|uniref:RNA polymerase II holoenzyme cyclin-like subunit n=1 Tax=Neofusicoccum ribis TaxID=45134 RepID=A0ABR3SKL6_9PEZI